MRLDLFAKTVLHKYKFLQKDLVFMDKIKDLAIKHECLDLIRYVYEKFQDEKYEYIHYEETSIKHPYLGEITKFKRKNDAKSNLIL